MLYGLVIVASVGIVWVLSSLGAQPRSGVAALESRYLDCCRCREPSAPRRCDEPSTT